MTAGARQRRMIGVSLGVGSTAEAQEALRKTGRSAYIAELRLDFSGTAPAPSSSPIGRSARVGAFAAARRNASGRCWTPSSWAPTMWTSSTTRPT